jgi:YfiH family protein
MIAQQSHLFSPDGLLVQSPALLACNWLLHGATTRRFSKTRDTQQTEMRRLLDRLDASGMTMVCGQQKHTNRVAIVTEALADAGRNGHAHVFAETDAIVCPVPEVCVFIFTADCLPIFLCDIRRRVVALAHAGWRGTLTRIAQRTVEVMLSAGCQPRDIIVWIGPCIGRSSYEVSEELIGRFRAEFADAERRGVSFFDGRLLDLTALNVHQLSICGIPAEHIGVSGLCTFRNRDLFHSYRAGNGAAGRIVSAIAVRGD